MTKRQLGLAILGQLEELVFRVPIPLLSWVVFIAADPMREGWDDVLNDMRPQFRIRAELFSRVMVDNPDHMTPAPLYP